MGAVIRGDVAPCPPRPVPTSPRCPSGRRCSGRGGAHLGLLVADRAYRPACLPLGGSRGHLPLPHIGEAHLEDLARGVLDELRQTLLAHLA